MTPNLPINIRIPLVVTLFMVAVSAFTSERVLSRLDETQTRHVRSQSEVYLEGLSIALVDAMVREDIWQVFDVLDRSQRRPTGLRTVETIVTTADATVIASSDPIRAPSQARLPEEYSGILDDDRSMSAAVGVNVAYMKRHVVYEGRPVGTIYAKVDISSQVAERRDVLWTLIVTNALLTMALATLASFIVARMMRPVRILTDHLERSGSGSVQPISDGVLESVRPEYKRTFAAYNALAKAMQEREAMAAQLAEEERLASLGRLASGMAHEINNPLGGLFNALDTLKRHGEQPSVRSRSIDLVERGLRGIRDVVRSSLLIYRADRDGRNLQGEDLDDLKLLVLPEARRRGIHLAWQSHVDQEVPLAASAVRQIVLNLVLNACQATPHDGCVKADFALNDGTLVMLIEDEGAGLPERAAEILTGNATLSAPIGDGSGLGLWMTNRLVRECRGRIAVESAGRCGTRVVVSLPSTSRAEVRHVA